MAVTRSAEEILQQHPMLQGGVFGPRLRLGVDDKLVDVGEQAGTIPHPGVAPGVRIATAAEQSDEIGGVAFRSLDGLQAVDEERR